MTIIVTCLLMAVAASAQGVKIAPKMQKGMKKTYQVETVMSVVGKEVKFSVKQHYVVKDRLADGWQVDQTVSDFSSNVGDDDIMGFLMLFGQQLDNGLTTSLKLDDSGRVAGLLNYDQQKQHALDAAEAMLNKLLEKHPEAQQMAPREALMAQLNAQMTEENIVKAAREASSVLAMNGRQVMTGAQEDYTNTQGLKMQRMFFLTKKDGSALTTSAKINMSKDELKQMVIAQIEKTMPDQVEIVKQNIDMMMDQMKFDATEKATYEFGTDGWVRSLTVETQQDALGQKTSQTTTIRLVE